MELVILPPLLINLLQDLNSSLIKQFFTSLHEQSSIHIRMYKKPALNHITWQISDAIEKDKDKEGDEIDIKRQKRRVVYEEKGTILNFICPLCQEEKIISLSTPYIQLPISCSNDSIHPKQVLQDNKSYQSPVLSSTLLNPSHSKPIHTYCHDCFVRLMVNHFENGNLTHSATSTLKCTIPDCQNRWNDKVFVFLTNLHREYYPHLIRYLYRKQLHLSASHSLLDIKCPTCLIPTTCAKEKLPLFITCNHTQKKDHLLSPCSTIICTGCGWKLNEHNLIKEKEEHTSKCYQPFGLHSSYHKKEWIPYPSALFLFSRADKDQEKEERWKILSDHIQDYMNRQKPRCPSLFSYDTRCLSLVEKDSSCNEVSCQGCHTKYCYICNETFPNQEAITNHYRSPYRLSLSSTSPTSRLNICCLFFTGYLISKNYKHYSTLPPIDEVNHYKRAYRIYKSYREKGLFEQVDDELALSRIFIARTEIDIITEILNKHPLTVDQLKHFECTTMEELLIALFQKFPHHYCTPFLIQSFPHLFPHFLLFQMEDVHFFHIMNSPLGHYTLSSTLSNSLPLKFHPGVLSPQKQSRKRSRKE